MVSFLDDTRKNKMPQKHVKQNFVMWWHLHFSSKCFEMDGFHFRSLFLFQNLVRCLFLELPFNASKSMKYPFFRFSESDGKMGHFKVFEHSGAFQRKIQMPSHDKYLLLMLFGVFHCTSRTWAFKKVLMEEVEWKNERFESGSKFYPLSSGYFPEQKP